MVGDFWSELLRSVGSLVSAVLSGRNREFVFADQEPSDALGVMGLANGHVAGTSATVAPPMWVQAKADLANLQKTDPNFCEASFLSQASRTYEAVLCAEGAMDASAVASLVTPAFEESFTARIEHWRSSSFTRVVHDLALDAPSTFKVAIGGEVQALTVRFTGSLVRFTREDMTGLVTDGSAGAESFTEFATFTRPAGATTPQSNAQGAPAHCQNCGAPVQDGAIKCAYCGATLTGTGGTWLLNKISSSAYT